jgi:uncharacterized protein
MSHVPQTELAPIPCPDERTAPYWQGLERGELLLQRCSVCGNLSHPIADRCRVCDSPRLEWSQVEGTGALFSWAVEGRTVIDGMEPPYVIAQVTPAGCDEGDVRLIGTLLVEDPSVLELGAPVRLVPSAPPGSSVQLAFFVLA